MNLSTLFTNCNLNRRKNSSIFSNFCFAVLDCDPQLNDMKELINELNKSNGLFKFVRTMREKFQDAAVCGMILNLGHFPENFVNCVNHYGFVHFKTSISG